MINVKTASFPASLNRLNSQGTAPSDVRPSRLIAALIAVLGLFIGLGRTSSASTATAQLFSASLVVVEPFKTLSSATVVLGLETRAPVIELRSTPQLDHATTTGRVTEARPAIEAVGSTTRISSLHQLNSNALGYYFASARTTSPEFVATESVPKVCPGNSFVGETLVLMADGSTKSIENVAVGDEVLTTDPETGRTEAHRVIDHITGEGEKHLVDVKVLTKDGVRTLVATGGHPFWITDTGKWVRASDFVVGEHFRSASAATEVIVGVRKHDEFARVHNLSVDGIHTYYILAGRDSVLVHNQSNPGYPVIPPDAKVRVLTPSQTGGAQYGVEYTWRDANGNMNRFRVHGPDGTAPLGSNAAEGEVSVWQIGRKYVGPNGELYPPGVVKPDSSNYDPVAANDIHRPWPGSGCP